MKCFFNLLTTGISSSAAISFELSSEPEIEAEELRELVEHTGEFLKDYWNTILLELSPAFLTLRTPDHLSSFAIPLTPAY